MAIVSLFRVLLVCGPVKFWIRDSICDGATAPFVGDVHKHDSLSHEKQQKHTHTTH
jgi:hypothetical protein